MCNRELFAVMEVYWNKGTLIKVPCITYKIRVQQAKISKIKVLFFCKIRALYFCFQKSAGKTFPSPPPPTPPPPPWPVVCLEFNRDIMQKWILCLWILKITSAPHRLLLNVIDKINYKKIMYKQYLNYLMDHVLNQVFQIILNIY